MDITIDGPTFYDQEDENIFFSCIYGLPDFERVRGHGMELTISFKKVPSNKTISQLLVICRRWFINPEPLKLFKNETNSEFFLWQHSIPLADS